MIPTSDKTVDAVLHRIGHAQPAEGLEQRIYDRLQRESFKSAGSFTSFLRMLRFPAVITAAAVACAGIVVGSVQHSRLRTMPATPGIHLAAPGGGLGAASGTRLAPPQPSFAPEHGHARSHQKATGGRATVQRDSHRPTGVAVPAPVEREAP